MAVQGRTENFGLSQSDIDILASYAKSGNRELYWNYLAQHEGSDGYGKLALGVVRNDNMPGATANSYAQEFAADQRGKGSGFDNRVLSERQWDDFGQTLLLRDLEQRQKMMRSHRPDLALNLPVAGVQQAHDDAFKEHKLDPNCWTPRLLLEAAYAKGGTEATQAIWKSMLDNSTYGVIRGKETVVNVAQFMEPADAAAYSASLLKAGALAGLSESSVDPNHIGNKIRMHEYSPEKEHWRVGAGEAVKATSPVARALGQITIEETDRQTIDRLNETRDLRLERQQKSHAFHPDDPYRTIMKSPVTLASEQVPLQQDSLASAHGLAAGQENAALHQQIKQHVADIDARLGRPFDETSERLAASLTVKAVEAGMHRVDHVALSNATDHAPAGHTVFLIQGDPADPAHLRAAMPTALAVQTPVEQSVQQLETARLDSQERALALQKEQQALDARTQESQSHSMRMG